MTCPNVTSAHDGLEPRQYVLADRSRMVLCRGCASVGYDMGVLFADRRSDAARPDRRGHGPLLDRLARVAA